MSLRGPTDDLAPWVPRLRRYARALAGNRDDADDLVQDTLERAWGRFSMWQRRGAIRSWMFGIMHNLYIDRLRSQRNSPEEDAGEELPEAVAAPADRLGLRDLERALQRLSTEQREVLLLVGVEEMSYREIASAIGVPIGTVMSRLSRARERLRAELDDRPAPAKMQRVK